MSFNQMNAWFALLSASLVLGCDRALVDPPPPVPPPEPPPSPAIIVRITPASVTVVAGHTQTFSATVENDRGASGVTWTISGCTGDAAACGSLSSVTTSSVSYIAPVAQQRRTIDITAASILSPAQVCSTVITVLPALALEQIAFVKNGDVYVVDADGSNAIRLTSDGGYQYGAAWYYGAAWSPDGSTLGFTHAHVGEAEIVVMNADGSSPRILTPHLEGDSARDTFCGWSPNGSQIGFGRSTPTDSVVHYQDEDGTWYSYRVWVSHVYVMNADGTGVRALSNQSESSSDFYAWLPDGRIAIRQAEGIVLMNPDGSAATTYGPGAPVWSPDGSKIAIGCNRTICVSNVDGSGLHELPMPGSSGSYGAFFWSRDGTKLAFSIGYAWALDSVVFVAESNWDIYAVNADGSGLTHLMSHNAGVGGAAMGAGIGRLLGGPAWSPDGKTIAITIDADFLHSAAGGIAVINAEGSGSSGINNTAGASSAPAWRPRRK